MSKIGALRDLLVALLHEHVRDGTIPTNARFLYYELVQRGELKKERTGARRPDQDLHTALTNIRDDGRIPWEWIVDETRSIENYTGHTSVRQGLVESIPYVTIDPWRGDPPMVITESRSLAGVLRHIVDEYRARIASINGSCTGFLHTKVAPTLKPGDRIIYLGDLDLVGDQIEDHTRAVLEQDVGGGLQWERLALTHRQVRQYDLPVITKRDRRYKDGRGVHEAVETEAISQGVLIDILKARLKDLLPEPLKRVHGRELRQRRKVAALLERTQ